MREFSGQGGVVRNSLAPPEHRCCLMRLSNLQWPQNCCLNVSKKNKIKKLFPQNSGLGPPQIQRTTNHSSKEEMTKIPLLSHRNLQAAAALEKETRECFIISMKLHLCSITRVIVTGNELSMHCLITATTQFLPQHTCRGCLRENTLYTRQHYLLTRYPDGSCSPLNTTLLELPVYLTDVWNCYLTAGVAAHMKNRMLACWLLHSPPVLLSQ